MSTPAWIQDILRGGLPELLDLGDQAPQGDESQDFRGMPPEQSPPSGYTGRDTANLNFGGFTSNQMKQAAFAIAAVVGVVWLAKKI